MNTFSSRLALLAVGLMALPVSTALAQTWGFNSDAQGWLVYDAVGGGNYTNAGTGALSWNAAGGNPGGYISAIDPSSGSFFFQAPISGVNYSAFNGGLLNFSLQTDLSPDYSDDSVVVFRGGLSNLTIVAALGSQPGVSWTNYSLSLNASAFRLNNLSGAVVTVDQFADVLSNLNLFLIDGEFHNGVSETTGLDSVAFVAPRATSTVPEPSVYGLAGAVVLVAISALRRRARR